MHHLPVTSPLHGYTLCSMRLMLLAHTICTFILLSNRPVFTGSGVISDTCPHKICMLVSSAEASQLHAPAATCMCVHATAVIY